jgi:hypothetical protein
MGQRQNVQADSPVEPAKSALLFMPFASIEIPSLAVSLLKPLAERAGVQCDIRHLHLPFRSRAAEAYDYAYWTEISRIQEHNPLEWVFSAALFGDEWAATGRAGIDNLMSCLERRIEADLMDWVRFDKGAFAEALLELRSAVPSFLEWCINTIPLDDHGLIGFSMSFAQVTASLALARAIKSRFPEKRIALGGFHCYGSMGPALMRLFPFVDMVFNGEADISFPTVSRG